MIQPHDTIGNKCSLSTYYTYLVKLTDESMDSNSSNALASLTSFLSIFFITRCLNFSGEKTRPSFPIPYLFGSTTIIAMGIMGLMVYRAAQNNNGKLHLEACMGMSIPLHHKLCIRRICIHSYCSMLTHHNKREE